MANSWISIYIPTYIMSYGYTHVPPQPASNHPTEQSLLILLRYITHISTPLSTLNNYRKFHFAFRTTFALHSAFSISISLSIAHTIFASFLINFTLFQTSAENSKLYYYNLAAGENSRANWSFEFCKFSLSQLCSPHFQLLHSHPEWELWLSLSLNLCT